MDLTGHPVNAIAPSVRGSVKAVHFIPQHVKCRHSAKEVIFSSCPFREILKKIIHLLLAGKANFIDPYLSIQNVISSQ